jgi:hypothetical protein
VEQNKRPGDKVRCASANALCTHQGFESFFSGILMRPDHRPTFRARSAPEREWE